VCNLERYDCAISELVCYVDQTRDQRVEQKDEKDGVMDGAEGFTRS
jgi:hypothetical protein